MGAPGPSIGKGFRGRANRKEYWLTVGALFALGMAMAEIAPGVSLAGALIVLYAQIRRLHDLGRTGWWAAGVLVLQAVSTLGVFFMLDETSALIVANAFVLIPIVVIGVPAGQPHENRFGPPPGQKPLKDVFG